VVDLVVDAAQEKESVAVWETHRMKLVNCPIQECANVSVRAYL
jgi:hypothetical protein